MRTTMDSAGRLVVPKAIRERLRLLRGGEVDVVERGGVIEIVPVAAAVEIVDGPGGAVATPVDHLPPLTDEQVLAAIDDSRR